MTDEDAKSRLLTLVFTDLADSTALKTRRGDAAIASLISRHTAHIKRLAADCGGRIIDWAGDGCFLTFETSSSAVLFALRLQQSHAEEADLPGVRIGIHMGEVTVSSNEDGAPRVAGLAVDLAARISGLARPGQVLMSAAVYDSARQRIGVESLGQPILWQAHGTYALKGFDKELEIGEAGMKDIAPLTAPTSGDKAKLVRRAKHPASHTKPVPFRAKPSAKWLLLVLGTVVVLALVGVSAYFAGQSKTSTPPPDIGPIKSLAVLPLDNLMNDPEQDYFADGMTEAVTGELSKIRALKVVSRTSVMQYKDTVKTAPMIAGELGVQGLIEGSVMRDGNKVRITVQLIDARSDTHLWAETYDGTLENVFELHSTVALAIANEVRAAVTPDEHARIARDVRVDPEAYDLYLRAGTGFDNGIFGAERALAELDQALRIAPDFAEAWSYKARAMSFALPYAPGDKADYIREASEAVTQALRLAPDDAHAHSASSLFELIVELDWQKAASEAARSVELNPNLLEAHYARASVALMAGDFPTAREALFKVIELDPHSTFNRATAAIHLSNLGDQTESLRILDAVLAEYPNYPVGLLFRSFALSRMGRHDEAVAAATRFDELAGGTGESRFNLAVVLGFAGRIGEARSIAEPFLSGRSREPAAEIARYRISIGETELALDSVEKAMDPPDFLTLLELRVNPFVPGDATSAAYVPLLESPRFWKLVDKLNFPPFPPGHPGYEFQQRWLAKKKAAAGRLDDSTFGARPAIAVLPFDNLSPDADQAFFADGLAEDLITRLASWRAFPVISRNSSFKYRGGNLDIKSVSAELGARYLVEGSVRRERDQIRVTAQLIDASTGDHVWAEKYDRSIKDVFAIQDEISGTIAASLVNNLNQAEGERARQQGTEDLEAWSLYALGLQQLSLFTREGFAEARRLFERSLVLDPRFVSALTHLAFVNTGEVVYGWRDASETLISTNRELVRRALDLDPRDAFAYGSLGNLYLLSGDVQDGLDASQRAVELNPSLPEAWLVLGQAQLLTGDLEASITSNKTVQRLDPQGPMAAFAYDALAMAYWETGRFDESFEAGRRLVAARPNYFWGYVYLALNNVALGHIEEAKAAIIEARRVQPGLSLDMLQKLMGGAGGRPEIDARRNAALRQAGLE